MIQGCPGEPISGATAAGGSAGARSCGRAQIPPQEMNGYVSNVANQPSPVAPKPGQHVFVAEHAVAPAKRGPTDAKYVLAKLPEVRKHDFARLFRKKYRGAFKAGLTIHAGGTLGLLAVQKEELRNPGITAIQTQLGQHHPIRIRQ